MSSISQTDLDLEQWRRHWQTPVAAADAAARKAELVSEIRRQALRSRLAMIGPTLVTLVAGSSTLAGAISSRAAADIVLAIGVWTFIVLVWGGALWMARGTWKPLEATTEEFLRISIRRCRSTLLAVRFAAIMYVAGTAGALLWRYGYVSNDIVELLMSWQLVLFVVILGPLLLWLLAVLARRKRAELAALIEAQQQLHD